MMSDLLMSENISHLTYSNLILNFFTANVNRNNVIAANINVCFHTSLKPIPFIITARTIW